MTTVRTSNVLSIEPRGSEGEDFELVAPMAWLTVGNVALQIKRHRDAVTVTAYALGKEADDMIDMLVVHDQEG